MLLGTCSCAVVRCVLCALSGFAAPGGRCGLAPVRVPWLWPPACLSGVPRGPAWCAAPRPVRSLSVLRSAFPTPWCPSPPRGLGPPALLGGCAGHAEAGREQGSLCLPLAPAEAGTLGSLRVLPVRGPAMGLSLASPSGAGLGLRALWWLACVDPVSDASGFPYRPSVDRGTRPVHRGCFVWTPTPPLWVGGRHAQVPCVCACARPSWPGRAGRTPQRVLVRLTFSFGRFVFPLCWAPSGLGLPLFWSFVFPPLPPFAFVLLFFFLLFCAPPLSLAFSGLRPVVLWALALCFVCFSRPPAARLSVRFRLVCVSRLAVRCSLVVAAPPPPPLLCLSVFAAPARCLGFFFLPPRAPVVSGFLWFPAPGALGLGAVRCLLCWSAASWLSVRSHLFRAFRLAVGCSLMVAAPPPPLCLAVFVAAARCCVPCAVLCVPGCVAAPRCCALCRPVLCCRVLCCFVALVWCRCLLRRALWRCPSP